MDCSANKATHHNSFFTTYNLHFLSPHHCNIHTLQNSTLIALLLELIWLRSTPRPMAPQSGRATTGSSTRQLHPALLPVLPHTRNGRSSPSQLRLLMPFKQILHQKRVSSKFKELEVRGLPCSKPCGQYANQVEEGELSDLIEDFSEGRVQFAFVKVKDSNTTLPKYVLIAWVSK